MSWRAAGQPDAPEEAGVGGDVPAEIGFRDALYDRFGVNEDGRGYFVADAGDHLLLLHTDEDGEVEGPIGIPQHRLESFIDQVREDVGWRQLEVDWILPDVEVST